MSTKCSIAWGEKFHLYHEAFEDDGVHLELEGADFEATPTGIRVKVPNAVMAMLKEKFKLDVSHAQLTDEEILERATKFVDDRIRRVKDAKAIGRSAGLISLLGGLHYGSAEAPREDQIAGGVAGMNETRARHAALLAEFEGLKAADGSTPLPDFVRAALPKEMVHSFTEDEAVKFPRRLALAAVRAGEGTNRDSIMMVHSTVLHPNGDSISLYVLELDDGSIYLTDLGAGLHELSVNGVKPTDRVVDVLRGICANSGIDLNGEEEGGKFHPTGMGKATTREALAKDFVKLIEALAKVTTLEYGLA